MASQAGLQFGWREEITATASAMFLRVDVYVFLPTEESHSLAHLTGFITQRMTMQPPRVVK
jgi:hypothetical protein